LENKILIVTEAGDAWPSGIVRALLFKDLFLQEGYKVTYKSRLSPQLIHVFNNRNRALRFFFSFTLSRLNSWIGSINEKHIIKIAPSFDIIYLQKVGSYNLVKALNKNTNVTLVYDLNDALWLPRFASFADGKISEILSLVQAVTCDNPQGREFALKYNPKSYIVPDSPNVELFDRYRYLKKRDNNELIIGWIGSHSTLYNLYAIWEPLEAVFAKHRNIVLRLIGSGDNNNYWPPFEKVRFTTKPYYNQMELIKEVLNLDIGIFPMFNVEASIIRGILKATIYMSGGVPVIGSQIGQMKDLIQDGQNGMLASNSHEWVDKLDKLVTDIKLRRTIGENGLQTVRDKFSLKSNFDKLCAVFQCATNKYI
jgi:glycosyltransferase involved in cell wall biosynthesis